MKAFISLGSNLFDDNFSSSEIIANALGEFLTEHLEILCTSKIYSSPAYPAGIGPDFTNAVVSVSTNLPPGEILAGLHRIEGKFGRTRQNRWEPRLLDLDLIAVDGQVLPDENTLKYWMDMDLDAQKTTFPEMLLLPHPRIQDRAFVLKPLCDIAPEWVHPVLGRTAKQLLSQLPVDQLTQLKIVSHI